MVGRKWAEWRSEEEWKGTKGGSARKVKGQVEVDGVCEGLFWLGAAGVCVCLQWRLTKMEGRQEGGGETHDTSGGETGEELSNGRHS